MGTTANKLQAVLDSKEAIRQAINTKGVSVSEADKLSVYASKIAQIEGGGSGWQPDPLWDNLHTIIENDTREYYGKVAILYDDNSDSFAFNLSLMQAQAVATSDGGFYTSNATHNWNRALDKVDSEGLKRRWIIWYYSSKTPSSITSNAQLFLGLPIWIVIGGDEFEWSYNTSMNTYLLQAIEFNEGGSWKRTANLFQMFFSCSSLQTIPLLDTSSVSDMNYMFQGCSSLQTIPLLDTSSVSNMSSMFQGCSSLQTIPLLDTSSVSNMSSMFQGCLSLQTIPLLDTSSVSDMSSMFSGCSSLQTIPLLDTSSVSDMNYMFQGCSSLQTIPLLDTSSVSNMSNMFNRCSSLANFGHIDFSSHITSNALTGFFPTSLTPATRIMQGTFEADTLNQAFRISINATYETIMSLIGALKDRTSESAVNLQLGATNLNKLSQGEKDLITAKGWTYS